jgi:hypothetical protein
VQSRVESSALSHSLHTQNLGLQITLTSLTPISRARGQILVHFMTFWEFVQLFSCNVYRTVGRFLIFDALKPRNAKLHTELQGGNLRTCAGPAGSVEPWAVCRYTCVYSVSCTRVIAFLNSLTVGFTIIPSNCTALLRLKGNRGGLSKSTLARADAPFESSPYDRCKSKMVFYENGSLFVQFCS